MEVDFRLKIFREVSDRATELLHEMDDVSEERRHELWLTYMGLSEALHIILRSFEDGKDR